MSRTTITALYWRAMRRVDRRARAYKACSCGPVKLFCRHYQPLAEACRTANRLAHRIHRERLFRADVAAGGPR